MTLIIGALNRRHAVLVSDRRLILNGRPTEDESNKAAVLYCRNARLAVAFTGLAQLGTFLTRRWLLEALSEAAEPDFLVGPLIERFADLATSKFASLATPSPSDKALTVFCAGYVYEDTGPRGVMALVSNFESWDGTPFVVPDSQFKVAWMREKRPAEPGFAAVATAGMTPALREEDGMTLRDLLQADKPSRAIVGKAVEVLRTAADSPQARNAIGQQCTSIVLPSNREEPSQSAYHSAVRSRILYDVSRIEARGGQYGIYMIESPEYGVPVDNVPKVLAGPKLGRNQPCWCGSGKKFKRCHGR